MFLFNYHHNINEVKHSWTIITLQWTHYPI